MNSKIFLCALLAGSVLATSPAMSQQRKTLLDVLFPKAYQKKVERRQRAAEASFRQVQAEQTARKVRKLPKVRTSRNYAYKVQQRAPIKLVAAPVVLAAAVTGPDNEQAVAQQISNPTLSTMTRDITASSKLNLSTEKHLAKAIAEFYNENQSYIWVKEDGSWSAKAKSVAKVLENASEFGLNKADYALSVASTKQVDVSQVQKISQNVPEVDDVQSTTPDRDALARERLHREISMMNVVLRYAMDASFGTVNPNRLSGYHDFPVHYEQAGDLVEKVVLKGLPANNLVALHPSNEKFAALRSELSSLQNVTDDIIDLKADTFLRPGGSSVELASIVAAVQKRGSAELLETHAETLAAYDGGAVYTKDIAALVKAYQREAGLGADGIIGKNTISKLAGVPSSSKIDRVKLAMERMRWLPHQLGERHVFINQPEYRARYIESGAEKLSMRVVVGKKSNQTNFFYDEIEHIEYNPYWNVPRSIIVNEFLPKSLGNPGYLDQRGYEVRTNRGQVSSSAVNWYDVGANPKISVRQPPGPKNALGELKIMFPNKHAIYMHDTPAKSLFKRQTRAFSHGCVRLHDPRAMAAAVMGTSKKQVASRIAQGKNLREKLPSKVPVYVSYFTAWPQENGTVKYFRDMYGRDTHLLKAMEATRKARQISISS